MKLSLTILGLGGLLAACSPAVRPTPPAGGGGMPFSLDLSPETWAGVVDDVLFAGPYTYLAVTPEAGDPRWVVVLGEGVAAGQRVVVTVYGTRTDFESKRLGRTFSSLAFSRVKLAAPAALQEKT